jgi:choice-of-anchor C domain-containing protein
MKKTIVILITMAALIITGAITAQASSFQNGDFEIGVNPGGFERLRAGTGNANNITGWTVESGNIDYVSSSYWAASSGVRSIDLNGDTAGTIGQHFNTTAGHSYRLLFDMSGNPDGQYDPTNPDSNLVKTIEICVNGGNCQQFKFDVTGMNRSAMVWLKNLIYNFTGVGSEHITITSLNIGDYGAVIDNLRFQDLTVPEPSTFLLFGAGLIGAAFLRRRFKK